MRGNPVLQRAVPGDYPVVDEPDVVALATVRESLECCVGLSDGVHRSEDHPQVRNYPNERAQCYPKVWSHLFGYRHEGLKWPWEAMARVYWNRGPDGALVLSEIVLIHDGVWQRFLH